MRRSSLARRGALAVLLVFLIPGAASAQPPPIETRWVAGAAEEFFAGIRDLLLREPHPEWRGRRSEAGTPKDGPGIDPIGGAAPSPPPRPAGALPSGVPPGS